MPIHRGTMGGGVNIPPTVLLNTPTQYNQDAIYSVSAYVNGSGRYPSIWFERSTDINFAGNYQLFSGTGSSTAATTTALSYAPAMTGLTPNTTYWIRCKVVTERATVFSAAISFTTWHLIQWSQGTPGTYYLTVPTVSGVNPAALVNVLVVGGGGGGVVNDSGGGGGGYRYTTSRAFNGTSGALTITVGGGGSTTVTNSKADDGGSSSITGTNLTTLTAGGGVGGSQGGYRGGDVGTGDNPAYIGGTYYADYSIKTLSDAAGGGAGVAGNGGNGAPSAGGAGGAGATINGYGFGSGGGAGGENYVNGTQGSHGSPTSGYGLGGNGHATAVAGTAGLVVFSYYGP